MSSSYAIREPVYAPTRKTFACIHDPDKFGTPTIEILDGILGIPHDDLETPFGLMFKDAAQRTGSSNGFFVKVPARFGDAVDYLRGPESGVEFHHFDKTTGNMFFLGRADPTKPTSIPAAGHATASAHAIILAPVDGRRWDQVGDFDQVRVLLIHETERKKLGNPGGRLNPGELPIDGCLREIEEEVGPELKKSIKLVGMLEARPVISRNGELDVEFIFLFIAPNTKQELKFQESEVDPAKSGWFEIDKSPLFFSDKKDPKKAADENEERTVFVIETLRSIGDEILSMGRNPLIDIKNGSQRYQVYGLRKVFES